MSIRLDDITLGYDRHPAVHHLSGEFANGSLTAVVGPNGAGKSTLLKGIKGLLPPLDGRIDLMGLDQGRISYLPQQAELDRDFPISVLDVVLLGFWRRVGALRTIDQAMCGEASAALGAVGLGGFQRRSVGSLSAGQRQRLLFARVLLEDSPAILLDEPFAAVDAKTTLDLLAIVHQWHGEGRTVVAVVHDLDQARAHFPETLLIARRPIGWGPTGSVLTSANLAKVLAMGEAWDETAPICKPRQQ